MGETVSRVGLGLVTGGLSEVARPFTKSLFKTPTPPQGQAPATTSDPAVQQALSDAAQRRSRARGWSSSILSQFMTPASTDLKSTLGS